MWVDDNSFPKLWLCSLFISYFEITTFTIVIQTSIKKKKKWNYNTKADTKIIDKEKYF